MSGQFSFKATRELVKLCQASAWRPDPAAVQQCVEHGADFFALTDDGTPLLHQLAAEAGNTRTFATCLKSARRPLDFTKTDRHGNTVMHCLVQHPYISEEEALSKLRAIHQHVCVYPEEDIVNWLQKDGSGRTFLSTAASNQVLSALWGEIRRTSMFAPDAPIALMDRVWEWDWARISPEDQKEFFSIRYTFLIKSTVFTGHLYRLSLLCASMMDGGNEVVKENAWGKGTDEDDTNEDYYAQVQHCVEHGAEVGLIPTPAGHAVLATFVQHGCMRAAQICLEAATHIQFPCLGTSSVLHTLLQTYARGAIMKEDVEDFTRLLVHRLETHPNDALDWGAKNSEGENFLELAARHQLLSALWPLVRHAPYYADQTAPIPLSLVWEWDWNSLEEGDEGKQCFIITGELVKSSEATTRRSSASTTR